MGGGGGSQHLLLGTSSISSWDAYTATAMRFPCLLYPGPPKGGGVGRLGFLAATSHYPLAVLPFRQTSFSPAEDERGYLDDSQGGGGDRVGEISSRGRHSPHDGDAAFALGAAQARHPAGALVEGSQTRTQVCRVPAHPNRLTPALLPRTVASARGKEGGSV